MGVIFGKIGEELPRHSLVHTAAAYTVRRYEPSIAACATYGAGRWGSGSDRSPFGALAKYIGVFGAPRNAKDGGGSERISMTAPVVIDAGEQSKVDTMMFLLPASVYGHTLDANVPAPTDPNVRLVQLPERMQAVRAFNGNLGLARAREQLELLLADLRADGWQPKPAADGGVEWQVAGYNAPFVLPRFKTNEVLVSVLERAAS